MTDLASKVDRPSGKGKNAKQLTLISGAQKRLDFPAADDSCGERQCGAAMAVQSEAEVAAESTPGAAGSVGP